MDATSQRILSTFDQLERESLDLHTLFEFAGGNQPEAHEGVLDAVATLVKKGLLRAEGRSDFYCRTEDGRLALAGPRDITLYTREACKLCEEAKAAILPLLSEFGAKLSEVDIDDDPVLHDRYTNDVPVIFLGSGKVAEHRVDLSRLRRQLEQAKQ
ncbi:MAG: glutaredoxin family protein [Candidatus Acidiferrales bacterium]